MPIAYLLDKKWAELHIGYLVEASWTLSSRRGCTGTSVMVTVQASLSFPYMILGISRESDEDFVYVTHPTRSSRTLAWFAVVDLGDSQDSLS